MGGLPLGSLLLLWAVWAFVALCLRLLPSVGCRSDRDRSWLHRTPVRAHCWWRSFQGKRVAVELPSARFLFRPPGCPETRQQARRPPSLIIVLRRSRAACSAAWAFGGLGLAVSARMASICSRSAACTCSVFSARASVARRSVSGSMAGMPHWQLLAPKMRFEIFAPDLCLAVGGLGICGGDARRHGVSRLDVAGWRAAIGQRGRLGLG